MHIISITFLLISVCVLGHSVSDSLQPHGLQPARLLHPRENTGVGCH